MQDTIYICPADTESNRLYINIQEKGNEHND